MERINIPQQKFNEMGKALSSLNIVEKDKVGATVHWQNTEYVITAGYGSGDGKSWATLQGYSVIDLALYKGSLKPLDYYNHFHQVDLGNRKRSYCGLKVRYGKRDLVLLEQYEFKPIQSPIQTQLTL